jgi:hypothetical protein
MYGGSSDILLKLATVAYTSGLEAVNLSSAVIKLVVGSVMRTQTVAR